MKNYKEMADSVFEKSRAIIKKQNERRKAIRNVVSALTSALLVVFIGVGAAGGALNHALFEKPDVDTSLHQLSESKHQPIESSGTQDINCEPPDDQYHFNSYREMDSALTDPKDKNFSEIREGLSETTAEYLSMLSQFEAGKLKCYVPTLDGDVIELEHATLFASELYGMPWLWYNCTVDEERLIVSISYAALASDSRLQSTKSYLDVQNIISPSSPSPDNYNRSSYDAIYEKELRLSNGTVTKALFKEPAGDRRLWIYIYHNGMLIRLIAEKSLLTDGFFESFELRSTDEIPIDALPSQKPQAEISA